MEPKTLSSAYIPKPLLPKNPKLQSETLDALYPDKTVTLKP